MLCVVQAAKAAEEAAKVAAEASVGEKIATLLDNAAGAED